MIRETSREAYNKIVESGAMGRQRCDVLRALIMCEPATSGEIAECLDRYPIGVRYKQPRHTVSRRLPELRDVGVVREHDPRKCAMTGTKQIVWSVTGDMPAAKPRPPTRAQLVAEVERLTAEVAELKALMPKQGRLL